MWFGGVGAAGGGLVPSDPTFGAVALGCFGSGPGAAVWNVPQVPSSGVDEVSGLEAAGGAAGDGFAAVESALPSGSFGLVSAAVSACCGASWLRDEVTCRGGVTPVSGVSFVYPQVSVKPGLWRACRCGGGW